MVSLNPNAPEGFYQDVKSMALPGINPFSTTPAPEENSPADDPSSKKIRKPYTISKSRESWTEPEHDKFLEALQLFDRDWKKIEAFVGSKTVIQIRSHAQKYFLKARKCGSNEHLPPPRPKRKASHPYPHNAPKSAISLPQPSGTFESSSGLVESIVERPADSAPMPRRPNNSMIQSWAANSQTVDVPSGIKEAMRSTRSPSTNNYSISIERTSMSRATAKVNDPPNHGSALRVLPDFSHVYNFIGSLFDPEVSDHLRRLKKMDPIDVETILLLIRNLSVNLTSPDFEDHRKLLASYDIDSGSITNSVCSG